MPAGMTLVGMTMSLRMSGHMGRSSCTFRCSSWYGCAKLDLLDVLYAGRLLGLNMSFSVAAFRFRTRDSGGKGVAVAEGDWVMFGDDDDML